MGCFIHVFVFYKELSLKFAMTQLVPPPWIPSSNGGRFLVFSFYNQSTVKQKTNGYLVKSFFIIFVEELVV